MKVGKSILCENKRPPSVNTHFKKRLFRTINRKIKFQNSPGFALK